MSIYSNEKIIPRNGHTLQVLIVARISGCASQKEVSLEDQVDNFKEEVESLYQGDIEYEIISTKGKGERLDRPEIAEVERILRKREKDILGAEDVGRIIRGTEAVRLFGIAVDHGVRAIAPNDCVDTAEETWEEDLISACRDHVGHNTHTSKRLKKKLMNRFKRYGAAVALPVVGYIKPEGAKTYNDWKIDENLVPLIKEGFERLSKSLNCSAVANFFNNVSMPLGEYCRRDSWDGAMIRRYYKTSLLKGKPGRGFTHTVKRYENGARIAEQNPKGPIYYNCPHLAIFNELELDDLNDRLKESNKNYRRKPVDGIDVLYRHPRKQTRFPGQHARCWYCGRHYVWGGNGITANLMCSGAREWKCWNSVGFNGELFAKNLVNVITEELYAIDGFDDQFKQIIHSASQTVATNSSADWKKLESEEKRYDKEKTNMQNAIAEFGPSPLLKEKLDELAGLEAKLKRDRCSLENIQRRPLILPSSISELRESLNQEFEALTVDSFEFGDLLRLLVPEVSIHLVRLCDGGHLLPRAKFKLNLVGKFDDSALVPELGQLLTKYVTIDVFQPVQREQIRKEAVLLDSHGLKFADIANRIEEHPTKTAVGNALALQSKMNDLGIENPYQLMLEPPEDYKKLRRHKNPKFRFEMLEGYQPADL